MREEYEVFPVLSMVRTGPPEKRMLECLLQEIPGKEMLMDGSVLELFFPLRGFFIKQEQDKHHLLVPRAASL